MRILVTGVSGFVGAHLVRELTAAGHEVWGSDRVGSRVNGLQGDSALVADMRDRDQIRQVLAAAAPDAIIHLAAQSSPSLSWSQPGETLECNTVGAADLFQEAARANGDVTFLFVSSSDVYGKGVEMASEFHEESPLNPHTPYAVSKLAAEQVITLLARRAGVRLVIARPFSHTGPGQTDRFVVPAFARQIAAIEAGKAGVLLHGDLEPCRDFCDVRDVVRAYRLLLEAPGTAGIYNICSGRAVSIASILGSLCSMVDCPIECRPDPERIRGEGPNPVHGSAARIRHATGWVPQIPLGQTLADVLAEQRQTLRGGAL